MSSRSPGPSVPNSAGGRRLTVQGWQNLVLSVDGRGGAGRRRGRRGAAEPHRRRVAGADRRTSSRREWPRTNCRRRCVTRKRPSAATRIAADRQFLEPYYDGQRTESTAAEDIRELVGHRSDLVDDLERDRSRPPPSGGPPMPSRSSPSVTPGVPSVVDRGTAERGKAEFDRLRELFDVQNEHLTQAASGGRRRARRRYVAGATGCWSR